MQLNGWNMAEDAATYRRDLEAPNGDKYTVIISAAWEENDAKFQEEIEGGIRLGIKNEANGNPGGQKQRGIVLRMLLDGEPAAAMFLDQTESLESLERFAADNPAEEIMENMMNICANAPWEREGIPEPPVMRIRQTTDRKGNLSDMKGWPHTPGDQRYEKALEFLQKHPDLLEADEETIIDLIGTREQWAMDVMNLASSEATNHFSKQALRVMVELGAREWHQHHGIIESLTWEGCSSTTIGGAINIIVNGREMFGLTRLQRHTDWMGFCFNLRDMKDAQALVMESPRQRGKPGIVMTSISGHPQEPRLQRATLEFPRGEASTLRDILTWHGVKECLWIPAEEKA